MTSPSAAPSSGGASITTAVLGTPGKRGAATSTAGIVSSNTPTGFAGSRSVVEILAGKDLSDPVQRAQVVAEMSEIEETRYEAVLAKADKMGIPVRIEGPGRTVQVLYDIREEGPLYRKTLNTNAAISTGANLLNQAPYGLNGQGMTVGVWDEARARTNHAELVGKVSVKDSTAGNSDHATHVAGTIAAKGVDPKAKGMGTNTLIHTYNWKDDYAEMTAAGAATAGASAKLPISNHSYGYGATNADLGRYETEASTTDGIAYSLPFYQIFWAAGNEQQDYGKPYNGYQSITFNGLAKNIITVGAANDAVSGGLRNPANATLASFSSMGPSDDGRIKPDLVANGVSVYSSVATSTNAYDGTYDGTSMATPNAAGSAALLQQLYKTNFSGQLLRASMLKGLLIHTADDRGRPGPDYQYGWGLVNVKAAADIILAQKASLGSPKLIEGTITSSNKVQSHTFTWDGTNAIRATLVWTDPAGIARTNNGDTRTRNLVHDLDVKITAPDGTTAFLPYVMPFVGVWTTASMTNNAVTGTNKVDNVERVDVASPPQAGTYTVTVGMYGTNVLTTNQVYSLIVTGGLDVPINPPPSVILDSPTNGLAVPSSTPVSLAATATDTVIGGGAGVVSKVEFLNGTNIVATLSNAPYTSSWTPPGPGAYSITARATDSEGAVGTSSAATVTVLTGDGSPSISSFSPTSAAPGASVVITGANFGGVSAVRFNGNNAALYTVDSPTQITVTVPTTATTGPLSVVTGFGTAVSATNFTVVQSPVLISQIYGAGGNTGATYNADYLELYNRSGGAVNLTGWSLQYASSSGTAWSTVNLTGTIGAGKYYLVRLSVGASGAALPTPDATSNIMMSGTQGKVALRDTTTAFTGSSPLGQSGLQDLVGYGSATAFEGSAPAPSPSTTTAILRAGAGATDTGDNLADFTASTPNPRNSAFGAAGAPSITSPLTATGTVGQAFTYQIAASNTPTSFNAVGLPSGLSINTGTGLISGTPAVAATSNVTISAANASGSDSKTLVLTINPSGGGGGGTGVVIFSENMGTPAGTTPISLNAFQNSGTLTFSGTADVRNNTLSSGYTNASGGGNVFVAAAAGTFFQIAGVNTVGYSNLVLSLGHFKSTSASSNELAVEVSSDGTNYTQLSYTRPTGNGTTTWLLITPTGTIPATANLRVRFRQTSATPQFRVDDVRLIGDSAATPSIGVAGSLGAVHTVYGTASTNPASFTLSGTNMMAGILVTPPPGFEVSQTAGGASGYAATQTVGAAGAISNTTVFVRLAAGTTAGQYSGNVVCSSAGAASVNVVVPPSNVNAKGLTITADNQSKPFGGTLSLGAGQTAFTPSGLVLGESVGTVTLAASGGTAANDAAGTYDITPSDATGGTFNPANYSINYVPGVLTVVGQTYGQYSSGLSDPAAAGDADRDGLPNVAEYFMGMDAALPNAGPVVNKQGPVLSLDYRRGKNTQDVTGVVKWRSSLGPAGAWSSNSVTDQFLSDHGTYELRRATVPVAPGDSSGFLRLEVTQP